MQLTKRITQITPSVTLQITSLAKKLQSEGKNIVNFAAGVLGRLIEAGYRDEVGEQAGEYLCFLLYQMSEKDIPNAPGVRYA